MKFFCCISFEKSTFIHIFAIAMNIRVIERSEDLPHLAEGSFFHSSSFFKLLTATPRQKPYLAVAEEDGRIVAHLLATVRYRVSWFPPYYYKHCRILGEGEYSTMSVSNNGATTDDSLPSTGSQQNALFGQMLHALRHCIGSSVLYIEVSNLGQKMFAYREFRQQNFFPIHWMSIHNSLHSRTPEERIGHRMKSQIEHAYQRGVITKEVETDEEMRSFSLLLRHHHWLKPKRYIPADDFFRMMQQQQYGRLYITTYHDHVIGCAAVVYSKCNAYLWYSAFRRKSYAFLHPDVLTIWHTLKDSHRRGFNHLFFLDVGLPFSRNPYREFILRFGGKPTSTLRWFRINIRWVNKLMSWIYRD